jgi:hypothetical protein
MTAEDTPPYRVADRHGEGWLRNGPSGTYTTFPKDFEPLTYQQLDAEHGPLRPVEAMTSEDHNALVDALAQAEKKATATLLVALHRTAHKLIDSCGGIAALTAGRPGSWEASLFRGEIVWLGERVKESRTDPDALATAERLLDQWTTGPVQVELADGLASVLGDTAEKAGGWAAITDQWLRGNEAIERWTAAYRRL